MRIHETRRGDGDLPLGNRDSPSLQWDEGAFLFNPRIPARVTTTVPERAVLAVSGRLVGQRSAAVSPELGRCRRVRQLMTCGVRVKLGWAQTMKSGRVLTRIFRIRKLAI